MTYKTRQREAILQVLEQFKEFTASDIYHFFKAEIGLTTIYRLLNCLEKEGRVRKMVGADSKVYYQYLKECNQKNHFYLKCDNCHKFTHIDCDCINDLAKHVLTSHKFKINNVNIVISGLCDACSKGETR